MTVRKKREKTTRHRQKTQQFENCRRKKKKQKYISESYLSKTHGHAFKDYSRTMCFSSDGTLLSIFSPTSIHSLRRCCLCCRCCCCWPTVLWTKMSKRSVTSAQTPPAHPDPTLPQLHTLCTLGGEVEGREANHSHYKNKQQNSSLIL